MQHSSILNFWLRMYQQFEHLLCIVLLHVYLHLFCIDDIQSVQTDI